MIGYLFHHYKHIYWNLVDSFKSLPMNQITNNTLYILLLPIDRMKQYGDHQCSLGGKMHSKIYLFPKIDTTLVLRKRPKAIHTRCIFQ